jgi:hypothetical protein
MGNDELNERLQAILDRFSLPASFGVAEYRPALDITKPNIHESKSEFLEEKSAVETAIDDIQRLIDLLVSQTSNEVDETQRKMSRRVRLFVDRTAKQRIKDLKIEQVLDTIRKNAADIGMSFSLATLLLDYKFGLGERKRELVDQEREFWSGHSRPPNHYARTMALRLARVVAIHKGDYPTIGVARDGNHPSTEFGRALEELFGLLEIKANFRRAGTWAIKQLSDDDLRRPLNALDTMRTL